MLYFDQERLLERPAESVDHFMPLHPSDLVDFLMQHPGLCRESSELFQQFASLILSMQHHLSMQQRSQLLYGYAPLDPDLDRMLSHIPTNPQRNRLAQELRDQTKEVLARANYRRLSQNEIEEAMQLSSMWGVRMRVKFDLQEWMEVYARGSAIGVRQHRHWRNLFRLRRIEIPVFSRLVVIFRPKENHPQKFEFRYVYLRLFKNVPEQDIDMMLPGAGIQMSLLDHSRIVLPSLYTVGITLWRILRNVFILAMFGVFKTVGMVVLILVAVGYGLKNLFSFRSNMIRRYLLNMTQSLYYQSLDNNSGVLLQLLEEAEQQQSCELILVYFVLQFSEDRQATKGEIERHCAELLREATGLNCLLDVSGSLAELVRLQVVHQVQDHWVALPLKEANHRMDAQWDGLFDSP